MARPLGSGPIHIWIGFGPPAVILAGSPPTPVAGGPAAVGAAQALYYGTTQKGVDTDEQLSFYPVMNDLTGPQNSMDDGYAGREDRFVFAMTSWTQAVDNALERLLTTAPAIGTDRLVDLGTLMVSEGMTVGVWMVKAAALKAVNVASGMPIGRYYPTCTLVGLNKKIEGNKENIIIRSFKAKRNINALVGVALATATLPLFTENPLVAGFSALPAPTFG